MPVDLQTALVGSILGTAIGDAVGLPCEGLSRRRQIRKYPRLESYHLLLGRGMVSDDTEHTCMVAQALIASGGNPQAFGDRLARQLRFWLLGAPAGIGLATLRACLRLCAGRSWDRSGVFSAGNGPAMRSALLGVCFGHDLQRLRELVRISTRITHTDPKSEYGALAVAIAAHVAHTDPAPDPTTFHQRLSLSLGADARELLDRVEMAGASAVKGQTTEEFADALCQAAGVSGYINHTVPVVLHAWFRHPTNFRQAIVDVVRCGGDTDTTAAVLGGIIGAGVGREGLWKPWLDGLMEWPRTVPWMARLGSRLAEVVTDGRPQRMLPLPLVLVLPRNALFLVTILGHGFRRLLPP